MEKYVTQDKYLVKPVKDNYLVKNSIDSMKDNYSTKFYNQRIIDTLLKPDYSIKPLKARPIAKYDNTTYALAGNSYNIGKRVG